ncbi:MAG: tRNA lysidine(34) synthetase TilS [Bacteroidales bacterium]|nr:tRNA lysidine(34) synthetase TilS [Bacteroidales bacterium]
MGFIERLKYNIGRHGLLPDRKPVIVAVSGGADSVALLAGLHELGYDCVAAHCNYHLRGEESNRDMRAVQDLCAQLGVDLYVRDFDVEARQRATGESLEMACRALRYDWFADLLDRQRAQAIAVAHHREDNVETFFINLTRGSGITGLAAMRWRNQYVIRPMLDFSRQEIEKFLTERGIAYVIDSTNLESVYTRNRWRNQVIPAIEQMMPGAVEGILASLQYLAENRDFYEEQMALKRAAYQQGREIDLAALMATEKHPRLVLYELLRGHGFNFSQIDDILASSGKSGLEFEGEGVRLELDRGMLLIIDEEVSFSASGMRVSLARDILSPVHILISEHPVAQFKPVRDVNVAFFDISVIGRGANFELRHWQRGDRMAPFGMHGATKLVSDIFAGAKMSAEEKRNAWLLTRNGEILWILGLRASELFSIGPETRRYLRLEYRR